MDKKLEPLLDLSKPTTDISEIPLKKMIESANENDVNLYIGGDKMHATVSGTKVLSYNGADYNTDVQMVAVPCPPESKMKELSPEHEIFGKLADAAKLQKFGNHEFVAATAESVFNQCGANYAAVGLLDPKTHIR